MPRDASCYGPPVSDSRPDMAAALTQPKICLFNMFTAYVLSFMRLNLELVTEIPALTEGPQGFNDSELATALLSLSP